MSLRENPLVVRFVRDLTYNPPTLLELSGRVIKSQNIPFNSWEVPPHLADYLSSAHQCVNPKCQGIFRFSWYSSVLFNYFFYILLEFQSQEFILTVGWSTSNLLISADDIAFPCFNICAPPDALNTRPLHRLVLA